MVDVIFFQIIFVYDYEIVNFFDIYFVISFGFTKSDGVKINLVHKFYHAQTFGIKKLEEFKDFLTHDQYSNCLKKGGKET